MAFAETVEQALGGNAFIVRIPGLNNFAVAKVSGLKQGEERTEIARAGDQTPIKQRMKKTVENVTIEILNLVVDPFIMEIQEWYRAGSTDKRFISISQTDLNETEIYRWELRGCYPAEFDGGDLDKKSTDPSMTTLVLSVDEMNVVR